MAGGFRQLLPQVKWKGILFLFPAFLFLATGFASSRFTEKQLEALEKYVGKTYWVVTEEGKRPLFFSAPSPSAASFLPEEKESFQATEMVEGLAQGPYYYRVKFDNGREGYIGVDSFLEGLNTTLVTVDPDRGQKIKSAKAAEEEARREARIRAQPWPEHVKEAVLKRRAVLGMNRREAREALGKPTRIVKVRIPNPLLGPQEQWIYESGPVLTFTNEVITRIQNTEDRAQ